MKENNHNSEANQGLDNDDLKSMEQHKADMAESFKSAPNGGNTERMPDGTEEDDDEIYQDDEEPFWDEDPFEEDEDEFDRDEVSDTLEPEDHETADRMRKEVKRIAMVDGIPRRNRLDLNTTAELALNNAINEVEKSGASPKLTDVVIALSNAKVLLSDAIDEALYASGHNGEWFEEPVQSY